MRIASLLLALLAATVNAQQQSVQPMAVLAVKQNVTYVYESIHRAIATVTSNQTFNAYGLIGSQCDRFSSSIEFTSSASCIGQTECEFDIAIPFYRNTEVCIGIVNPHSTPLTYTVVTSVYYGMVETIVSALLTLMLIALMLIGCAYCFQFSSCVARRRARQQRLDRIAETYRRMEAESEVSL